MLIGQVAAGPVPVRGVSNTNAKPDHIRASDHVGRGGNLVRLCLSARR